MAEGSIGVDRGRCGSASRSVETVQFSVGPHHPKASLPIPFEVGSTTVRAMAMAIAASTALPPA